MSRTGADPALRMLVDTSAYSHLRGGHPEVHRLVAGASDVLMSVVVVGELEAAFAQGSRRAENTEGLEAFLSRPYVSLVPLDRSIATRYGSLWADLRRAGTPMGTNDIWIAATALDADADLVTFDTDFVRVPDLRVVILSADTGSSGRT